MQAQARLVQSSGGREEGGEAGGRQTALHNVEEAAQNVVGVINSWLDTLVCTMY